MGKSNREYKRHVGILGIAIISLFVIIATSGLVAAHTGDGGSHHHDGWMGTHGGMDGWMGGGIGVGWMLLWTIILIGIPVTLVYLLLTRRESGGTTDDAVSLLRQRYAEGEIDEEEYESRRTKLLADDR